MKQERASEYQIERFTNKGHGRREVRLLESSPTLCDYFDWPGVGQVFRRQSERLVLKTGSVRHETTYGITSLLSEPGGPIQLETLCRGHWTIENRVHYVCDVTMGEDANQTHVGHATHALAPCAMRFSACFVDMGGPTSPPRSDTMAHRFGVC